MCQQRRQRPRSPGPQTASALPGLWGLGEDGHCANLGDAWGLWRPCLGHPLVFVLQAFRDKYEDLPDSKELRVQGQDRGANRSAMTRHGTATVGACGRKGPWRWGWQPVARPRASAMEAATARWWHWQAGSGGPEARWLEASGGHTSMPRARPHSLLAPQPCEGPRAHVLSLSQLREAGGHGTSTSRTGAAAEPGALSQALPWTSNQAWLLPYHSYWDLPVSFSGH